MIKQITKKLIAAISLVAIFSLQANNVTPTLAYRSQGFHADRQRNVAEVGHINLYDMQEQYGTLDVALGYSRSFRSEKIAESLFGCDLICNNDCKNLIKVQGSGVASRDSKAWLADYFYLNCDYDGCFSINPRIQNFTIDLDFYLGLDEWFEGLYFRTYGPITYTKWDTQFCYGDPANVITTSCSTGYLTPSGNEVLLGSIADYFSGCAPAGVDRVVFKGLNYAKMPICDESKWGFAELRTELGWNFVQGEDYHLGIGIHGALPTGGKRKAEYVMQPVVGNGDHWEFGGTAHGHYVFWRSEDEARQIGLYVDALFTHMFRAREQRTFDLCCKDNSRYMLAAKYTHAITNGSNISNTGDGLSGIPTSGTLTTSARVNVDSQFDYIYAPVANLTTTDVKVRADLHADFVAMLNMQSKGFSWDLGYNFWYRSAEKIECPRECNPCNSDSLFNSNNANTWALKGDAHMFGFAGENDSGTGIVADDEVPLSASQSNATIHAGTNASTVDATLTSVTMQNAGVDNAQFAVTGAAPRRVIHTPISEGGLNIATNNIKTSVQTVFLSPSDVSLQETRGYSNTIFTNLNYTWDSSDWECDWTPYLGVGGSLEFGYNDDCEDCCDSNDCASGCSYLDTALSQWSIWFKGGVSFN